ncbi:hypothetical protein NKG94_02920 [Micromonospora sp. M12]
MLLIATALGIGGFMTLQTYLTPFLLDVSGFTDALLAPLLFAAGAAGVVGTLAAARTLDARPIASCWRRWPSARPSCSACTRSARSSPVWSRSSPG